MKLKSILIVAALVASCVAFTQGAGAPPKGGAPGQGGFGRGPGGGQGGPGGGFRMRTPKERVDRLAKTLGLTDAQKKKLLPIYEASAKKGKELFENKKLTDQQKRAAFMKMREENNAKIKKILTAAQIKKMEEMRQRGPGGPGRGPGGPGGGKPGAPGKPGGKG